MNKERRWSTDDGDTYHMNTLSKSELFWKKWAIVSVLVAIVIWTFVLTR